MFYLQILETLWTKFKKTLDRYLQIMPDQLNYSDDTGLWVMAFNRLDDKNAAAQFGPLPSCEDTDVPPEST